MTPARAPYLTEGGYKLALNPIQWFASADGFHDRSRGPQLGDDLAFVRSAGFEAVPAALPAGMTVAEYRGRLDQAGLVPGPGYFAVPSPEQNATLEEIL